MIFGLAVAVAFWPGAASGGLQPRWAVMAVGAPLLLAGMRSRGWTLPHLAWLALVAWALLSLSWTANIYDGIGEAAKLGILAMVFAVGARMESLRPIIVGLALGLTVSAVVAAAQWLDKDHLEWLWPRTDGHAGLWVNQNTFAEIGAAVIVAAAVYRLWWLLPGLLPIMLLTESRAAKLSIIAALLVGILPRSKHAAAAVVLGAGATAAILWWLGYKAGASAERLSIWLDTWAGVTWLGHGLGSFSTLFPLLASRIDTFTWSVEHAHSDALEALFELGVVGLGLACVCAAVAFRGPLRLVWAALGTQALLGFPLHLPGAACLAALVAGHATRAWPCIRDYDIGGRVALQLRLASYGSRAAILADAGATQRRDLHREHP